MDVWMDRDGQVVFFDSRGKAVLGAPVPKPLTAQPVVRPDHRAGATPQLKPLAGAARYRRDIDVPWEVEARAWEALDSG